MKKVDFKFKLPEHLIAQYPLKERTDSRLLKLNVNKNSYQDANFSSLIDVLNKGDLVVLNDTKVIPARLYGTKQTGGKVELLLERVMEDQTVLCFMRASRRINIGTNLDFNGEKAQVIARQGEYFLTKFEKADPLNVFMTQGHIPLPPYITRDDQKMDISRYQTVFAENQGAVAAPTAGLHFDKNYLTKLEEKGIKIAKVTLHVGSGTFHPVRVDDLSNHIMHKERVCVTERTANLVNQTKANGNKVVAIGTTVVRSLESASKNGICYSYKDETDIFITPSYKFNVIDSLVTNFHLPESTLIMLVSAFAGHKLIMDAYKHAVDEKYRFFSYGDAMLIEKK